MKTTDFEDPVFKPYVIKPINGIPVAIVGQAFPYTPIANPRYFTPDWSFGIQDDRMQEMVDEARGKGAQVVQQVQLRAGQNPGLADGRIQDLAPVPARLRNNFV